MPEKAQLRAVPSDVELNFDEFETTLDDNGYSIDKFYPSSSLKGSEATNIGQVKVPVHLARIISEVVQSGKIPAYKTRQDIVRDAIYHRLKYLAGPDGMLKDYSGDIDTIAAVEAMRVMKLEREAINEGLRLAPAQLESAAQTEDHNTLLRAIKSVETFRDTLQGKPARDMTELIMRYRKQFAIMREMERQEQAERDAANGVH